MPYITRKFPVGIDQTGSAVLALFLIGITDFIWMNLSEDLHHWFVVPVSICGVLMATDALDWLRGRLDLYDPFGLVGLMGVHFFFVAPLLHASLGYFMTGVTAPPDWRDWLGYMGYLNAAGLIAYRLCRYLRINTLERHKTVWIVEKHRFNLVLIVSLLLSVALQIVVYAKFGGLLGYMDVRMVDPHAMDGMGVIFMMSESAPILLTFLVIIHLGRDKINWIKASAALLVLLLIELYFGGLRGSRSETLELYFWVIGCVHYKVRPVPKRFVLCGCLVLAVFMYFYAFYKSLGTEGAARAFAASAEERAHIAEEKRRSPKYVALGDFGRADVQAFVLYRLINDGQDFDYGLGRTYLGAVCLWIPHWILPNKPDTKLREGTEIQDGTIYDPNFPSSRVYGLAAEGMLNFGPLAVPISYAAFGWVVGWLRRTAYSFWPQDMRLLLVPFGVFMLLGILIGDSDNVAFGLVKNGLVPILVVVLSSRRLYMSANTALTFVQQQTVLNVR